MLGVSESRVSQIIKGIIKNIRRDLYEETEGGPRDKEKKEFAMESVREKEIAGESALERGSSSGMEKTESDEMESYFQAGFDEWLT